MCYRWPLTDYYHIIIVDMFDTKVNFKWFHRKRTIKIKKFGVAPIPKKYRWWFERFIINEWRWNVRKFPRFHERYAKYKWNQNGCIWCLPRQTFPWRPEIYYFRWHESKCWRWVWSQIWNGKCFRRIELYWQLFQNLYLPTSNLNYSFFSSSSSQLRLRVYIHFHFTD